VGGTTDEPNQKYRDAHVWYDSNKKGHFAAYELLFGDVVEGRLRAVRVAVTVAGAVVQGSREGVDLPETNRAGQVSSRERFARRVLKPHARLSLCHRALGRRR
jgi:hypothetical protein